MYKEIVILAKSSKHDDYCIAGIDINTGEWIRPISTNKLYEGAVPLKDILYEDGTELQILDKVKIKLLSHKPTLAQPENYIYDATEYWEKTGVMSLNQIIRDRGFDAPRYIFCNSAKELSDDDLDGQGSLLFICAENSRIFIKTFDNGDRRLQFNFYYNGESYNFFKISDENIRTQFASYPDGSYNCKENLPVVFSLTDKYIRTGKYYKMVAQIFN